MDNGMVPRWERERQRALRSAQREGWRLEPGDLDPGLASLRPGARWSVHLLEWWHEPHRLLEELATSL